ncbi:MAG: zinc ribbon domain-containing protein [Nitrospirae bacterium]|nr:zinc ribbon domain-containing protein [Nitrospirota bacterium]
MPTYDFKCQKCDGTFSKVMSVSEKETRKVKCPECKSVKVKQVYSGFIAKTSRKS